MIQFEGFCFESDQGENHENNQGDHFQIGIAKSFPVIKQLIEHLIVEYFQNVSIS
jgi:hypothetical protein